MLVNLAACPISIKNCNTSGASLPRILLLSRIISLWLIVGILLGFGGFSVLWCLIPLPCIILVADWCWVTVILINVLLYCYRAVAPFFLSVFFSSLFLLGFSLSFTDRIFLLGFYSPFIGRIYLSRIALYAIFLHRRLISLFCCFLLSLDMIYLSRTDFWALSLHRHSDWSSYLVIHFQEAIRLFCHSCVERAISVCQYNHYQ